MAGRAIASQKAGVRKVPTPPQRASMVPGSRPENMRMPPMPRVTPMAGQRNYGKPVVPQQGPGMGGAVAGPMGQDPFGKM